MLVFVTRKGAGLGEALVALVARVESLAVLIASCRHDHSACNDRSRCQALHPSVVLCLLAATPGRDVGIGRGSCVPTVIPTGVARLAALIARADGSQERSLDRLFFRPRCIR